MEVQSSMEQRSAGGSQAPRSTVLSSKEFDFDNLNSNSHDSKFIVVAERRLFATLDVLLDKPPISLSLLWGLTVLQLFQWLSLAIDTVFPWPFSPQVLRHRFANVAFLRILNYDVQALLAGILVVALVVGMGYTLRRTGSQKGVGVGVTQRNCGEETRSKGFNNDLQDAAHHDWFGARPTRTLLNIANTGLFMPVATSVFRVFVCLEDGSVLGLPSSLPCSSAGAITLQAICGVLLLFWILAAILSATTGVFRCTERSLLGSKGYQPFAKVLGTGDIAIHLGQLVVYVLQTFLPEWYMLRYSLLMVFAFLIFAHLVRDQPFYEPLMNHGFSGSLFMVVGAAIHGMIAARAVPEQLSSIEISLWVTLFFFFVAGWATSAVRINWVMKQGMHATRQVEREERNTSTRESTSSDVPAKGFKKVPHTFRSMIRVGAVVATTFKQPGVQAQRASNIASKQAGSSEEEPKLFADMKFSRPADVELCSRFVNDRAEEGTRSRGMALYETGRTQFPQSAELLIQYALYLAYYQDRKPTALACLRKAKLMRLPFSLRFAIHNLGYLLRHEMKNSNEKKTDSALSWISYVEFQRRMDIARGRHRAALNAMKDFWSILLDREVNLNLLPRAAKVISDAENLAQTELARLLERFPRNASLLRAYGRFMLEVKNDVEKSDELFSRADECEEESGKMNEQEEDLKKGQEHLELDRRPNLQQGEMHTLGEINEGDEMEEMREVQSRSRSSASSSTEGERDEEEMSSSKRYSSKLSSSKQSAGMRRRHAAYRQNLTNRKSRAIQVLDLAVKCVTVVLIGLAIYTFAWSTSTLNQLTMDMEEINVAGTRLGTIANIVRVVDELSLEALGFMKEIDEEDTYDKLQGDLHVLLEEFFELHRELFLEDGSRELWLEEIRAVWEEPNATCKSFADPKHPDDEEKCAFCSIIVALHKSEYAGNLWDLGMDFYRFTTMIGHYTLEEYQNETAVEFSSDLLFVSVNGMECIPEAFDQANEWYVKVCSQAKEESGKGELRKLQENKVEMDYSILTETAVIIIFVGMASLLGVCVFRPTLRNVGGEHDRTLQLFKDIPKSDVKKIWDGLDEQAADLDSENDEEEMEVSKKKKGKKGTVRRTRSRRRGNTSLSTKIGVGDRANSLGMTLRYSAGLFIVAMCGCIAAGLALSAIQKEITAAREVDMSAMRGASAAAVLGRMMRLISEPLLARSRGHESVILAEEAATRADIEKASAYHAALMYGSEEYGVHPASQREGHKHILFGEEGESDHGGSGELLYESGLHILLQTWLEIADRVLLFAEDAYEEAHHQVEIGNTTLDLALEEAALHIARLEGISTLTDVYEHHLYPLLMEASHAYIVEVEEKMNNGITLQGVMLAVNLIVIVIVFFLVFMPMVRHVMEEFERTRNMLLLVPMQTVDSVLSIRQFLESGLDGGSDEKDKSGDEKHSERRVGEELLHQYYAALRHIGQGSKDAVFTLYRSGQISWANEWAKHLSRRGETSKAVHFDIKGMNFADMVLSKKDSAWFEDVLIPMITGGSCTEKRFDRKVILGGSAFKMGSGTERNSRYMSIYPAGLVGDGDSSVWDSEGRCVVVMRRKWATFDQPASAMENKEEVPDSFVSDVVLNQMRTCGLADTVRIRSGGFPIRRNPHELLLRFSILLDRHQSRELQSLSPADACTRLLSDSGLDDQWWRVGKTKVFMRDVAMAFLLEQEEEIQARALQRITALVLGWRTRRQLQRQREAAVVFQAQYRCHRALVHYHQTQWLTGVLQSLWRGYRARKHVDWEALRQHRAARLKREQEQRTAAALMIQRMVRGHLARNAIDWEALEKIREERWEAERKAKEEQQRAEEARRKKEAEEEARRLEEEARKRRLEREAAAEKQRLALLAAEEARKEAEQLEEERRKAAEAAEKARLEAERVAEEQRKKEEAEEAVRLEEERLRREEIQEEEMRRAQELLDEQRREEREREKMVKYERAAEERRLRDEAEQRALAEAMAAKRAAAAAQKAREEQEALAQKLKDDEERARAAELAAEEERQHAAEEAERKRKKAEEEKQQAMEREEEEKAKMMRALRARRATAWQRQKTVAAVRRAMITRRGTIVNAPEGSAQAPPDILCGVLNLEAGREMEPKMEPMSAALLFQGASAMGSRVAERARQHSHARGDEEDVVSEVVPVHEVKLSSLVALVDDVKEAGGKVHIFSTLHVSGEQLDQLTGMAAILRFPMLDLDDVLGEDSDTSSSDESGKEEEEGDGKERA